MHRRHAISSPHYVPARFEAYASLDAGWLQAVVEALAVRAPADVRPDTRPFREALALFRGHVALATHVRDQQALLVAELRDLDGARRALPGLLDRLQIRPVASGDFWRAEGRSLFWTVQTAPVPVLLVARDVDPAVLEADEDPPRGAAHAMKAQALGWPGVADQVRRFGVIVFAHHAEARAVQAVENLVHRGRFRGCHIEMVAHAQGLRGGPGDVLRARQHQCWGGRPCLEVFPKRDRRCSR